MKPDKTDNSKPSVVETRVTAARSPWISHGRLRVWNSLLWGRVVLGAIFIFAGVDKILHPDAFAAIIKNYQILPVKLISLAAVVLPWLELILGISLIAGVWLPGAVTLSNLLLIVFFGTMLFNMARGLDVNCGCFSTSPTAKSNVVWYVFRDLAFLLLGLYLLYHTMLGKGNKQHNSSHA
jgi:uncharacterized membrane protein YphA (DoxX/SURF4 family)